MQEQWKPISGYEGIYEVSNLGNVRSIDRIDSAGRHLQGITFSTKAKQNYVTAILTKEGKHKSVRVHRLVAEAFIPNPESLTDVNHKDGNKQNNCAENLEWCSHSENMIHAYKNGLSHPVRKLTDDAVQIILESKGSISAKSLSKEFGVSFQLIYQIWKAGGRPCKCRIHA